MTAPIYSASDYAGAFQALLPYGVIWPREVDAVQSRVALAVAPVYARNGQRAAALLADSPTGLLDELLPEWERSLGLPDPCAGDTPTVAQRRAQVIARLTARGGQSVPYFVQFAAALGYTITVTEFAPSRFPKRFGSGFGGEAWAHTWRVTTPSLVRTYFGFGQSGFGEGFSAWGSATLECELRRIAPAHTILQFAYVGPVVAAGWSSPGGWDKGGWVT